MSDCEKLREALEVIREVAAGAREAHDRGHYSRIREIYVRACVALEERALPEGDPHANTETTAANVLLAEAAPALVRAATLALAWLRVTIGREQYDRETARLDEILASALGVPTAPKGDPHANPDSGPEAL